MEHFLLNAAMWYLKRPPQIRTSSVKAKGNQPWIFIGRTDAEAEAPILWPPDAKSWLTGKDPDAGKGWEKEKKRVAEDKIIKWHHQLNGQ